MVAPMWERTSYDAAVCIACETAGRTTDQPSGRDGELRYPIQKLFVASADGSREFLAQICPVCDQFPPAPHIRGTR